MRFFRSGLFALTLLSVSLVSAAAHAESIKFDIVGGGEEFYFSLSNSTSIAPFPGGLLLDSDVFAYFEQTPGVFVTQDLGSPVVFFNGGGIAFSELFFSSPDLFNTGLPLNTPIEVDLFSDPDSPYQLTLTDSAETPEPSSLALLGSGVLATVGIVRRRHTR